MFTGAPYIDAKRDPVTRVPQMTTQIVMLASTA